MGKVISFKNMNQIQKLIFIITIAIILVVLAWILRIVRNNSKIKNNALVNDYSKISDSTDFSVQGNLIYDRQIYWDLNDIIASYINSVKHVDEENEYTIKSYYNALTEEYKLHLGENGYIELANNFINKFKIESVQEINYKTDNIIDEIHELPNNMYLCDLIGTNDQEAHIGIVLDKIKKTFQIFYIE